ncbi:hypothetical protein ACFQFQ_06875 [Sulfitobacter porphyrae]|uniref:Uncharacterized protein n=1 Tax=Sulfitobacter porphyrae TaxID=1246864 RepID=A0ABW2B0P6_9RHOB
MPTIKGAPLVRPAGRRWPGAFGLFRAWVPLIDGCFVHAPVFHASRINAPVRVGNGWR